MVVTRRNEVKIGLGTAVVGVDVGMKESVSRVRAILGRESAPLRFRHCRSEYERFWSESQRFAREQGCGEVVYGYESTGVYARPLAWYLAGRGAKVVQVSTVHVKRAKEITDNSPNKHDKKDPRVVADLIQMGRFLTVPIPTGRAGELRVLTNARERLLHRRTELYNQLHALVFMVFPEMQRIMGSFRTKTMHSLLRKCPLPAEVVALGLSALTQEVRTLSRGRKGQAESQELFKAAVESVGVTCGRESIKLEIGHMLDEVEVVERHLREVEKRMEEQVVEESQARLLLSIPRLGKLTVAVVLGEVGSFADFERIHEMMKFSGLDLYEISSGKHQGRRRISKRGRSYMRKYLFYAAMGMAREGGIFHDMYKCHVARGMKRTQALTALARRLLRIMFSMARSGTAFEIARLRSPKERVAAAA